MSCAIQSVARVCAALAASDNTKAVADAISLSRAAAISCRSPGKGPGLPQKCKGPPSGPDGRAGAKETFAASIAASLRRSAARPAAVKDMMSLSHKVLYLFLLWAAAGRSQCFRWTIKHQQKQMVDKRLSCKSLKPRRQVPTG